MRARYLLAVLPLLLAACVTIPIPVRGPNITVQTKNNKPPVQTTTSTAAESTTSAAAAAAAAVTIGVLQDAAIESALGRIRRSGDEDLDRAQELHFPSAEIFVFADPAKNAVRELQRKLLAEFQGAQYAGIRPELQAVAGEQWVGRLQVLRTPAGEGVAKSSVDSVFAALVNYVRDLMRRPEKRVTFRVQTEPTEATFRICPQYLTQQCFELMTDGDVAAILRGYYTYRITLAGFKPVEVNIDLVPFGKSRLRCILRRDDDVRDAGPCTPE